MKKIFSVLLVLGLLISLSNSANPSQAATLKRSTRCMPVKPTS